MGSGMGGGGAIPMDIAGGCLIAEFEDEAKPRSLASAFWLCSEQGHDFWGCDGVAAARAENRFPLEAPMPIGIWEGVGDEKDMDVIPEARLLIAPAFEFALLA